MLMLVAGGVLGCDKKEEEPIQIGDKSSEQTQPAEKEKEEPTAEKEQKRLPASVPNYFGAVEIGMTEKEIVDAMGEPDKRTGGDDETDLVYEAAVDNDIAAEKLSYKVDSDDGLILAFAELAKDEAGFEDYTELVSNLRETFDKKPSRQALFVDGAPPFALPISQAYEKGRVELWSYWRHSDDAPTYLVSFNPTLPSMAQADSSVLQGLLVGVIQKSNVVPLADVQQIGRPFQLGEFEYIVESVTRPEKVGKGYSAKSPSDGARWVEVRYTIENIGKKTATGLSGDLLLVDDQDRQFSPSSKGTTAVAMSEDVDLALSQLQPGIRKKQIAVFEVPKDVASNFEIIVPEKGLVGSGKEVLEFRFPEYLKQKIAEAQKSK